MWSRPRYYTLVATLLAATSIAPSAHAVTIGFENVLTLPSGQERLFGTPGQVIPEGTVPQVSQEFNFNWVEIVNPFQPLWFRHGNVCFVRPNIWYPLVDITHGHLSNTAQIDGGGDLVPVSDPLNPHYIVTDNTTIVANTLTISQVNGDPFSIQSFNVAKAFSLVASAATVEVTGNFTAGGSVTEMFALSGPISGTCPAAANLPSNVSCNQFESFLIGFSDMVDSVIFEGLGSTAGNYFAIDEILVDEPIVVDPNDPDDTSEVPEPSSLAIFGFATIMLGWIARRRASSRS